MMARAASFFHQTDVYVGIVSIGDVVKHKLSQLEYEREQLENYVHQQ